MLQAHRENTDEALALAAARDEAGAFDELLRRYQVPLLGFLRRRSHHQQDAEDLLQETALRLYASRRQYRARWRFRTWAFTIARRAAIDLHRRRAREAATLAGFENDRIVQPMSPASNDFDHSDGLWRIARHVLTREQADALWLFHVESIPPREIAKILDRSWVSVKTMLHRARKQIRVAIDTTNGFAPAAVRNTGGA